MKNSTFTSIQIQDFGPVWRGKVELRPLTVFTGASNTGKSWVAMLVYALAQHSLKSRHRNFIFQGGFDDEIEDSIPAKKELDLALDGVGSERGITVSETLLKFFDSTRAKETKYLEIEIARTFGFQEIKQAINWNSKRGASVHVTSPANGISKTPSLMSIKLGKNHFRYESEYPETLDLGKLTKHEKRRYDMFRRLNLENQGNNALKINKYGLARFFYRLLSDRFFPSGTALYLPAGRVGLMDSFRTIVGSSIQSELDNVPIGQFQSRPLSGVLVDFLQMLTGVTPKGKSKLRNSVAF